MWIVFHRLRCRAHVAAPALAVIFISLASATAQRVAFPIPSYLDAIAIPVNIGGGEHLFLVDSGFTSNAVHTSLIPKLGEYRGARTMRGAAGEPFHVELYSSPTIRIGAIELIESRSTVCFDMLFAREALGRNIEGILGMPLFRENTVQIDFDQRQLTIFPSSANSSSDWGTAIPVLDASAGRVAIKVAVGDGIVEECIVDTGFTGCLALSSATFAELVKKKSIAPVGEKQVVIADGMHKVQQGLLKTIKVGDLENHDLYVASSNHKALVGLGYLRRFRVTFDFARKQMYLAKRAKFEPDAKLSIGVALLRKTPMALLKPDLHTTIVSHIQPGSLAEKAGVRLDDELIAVDGEPIADKPIAQIQSTLLEKYEAKGKVNVQLHRDGEERSISISVLE